MDYTKAQQLSAIGVEEKSQSNLNFVQSPEKRLLNAAIQYHEELTGLTSKYPCRFKR